MQAILRTAKEKNAKFVAIPSLGVGNLHFSAHTSAEIIYDEIICFSHRNPGSVMKYLLVIYDQKAFDEFSKVHAQKMNSAPAIKVSLFRAIATLRQKRQLPAQFLVYL